MAKSENPPNVPEARPIEDFWSILKGLVYEGNWQAKNLAQLKARIMLCLRKIDIELVKRLARSIPSRLKKIHERDVIEMS